MKNWTDLLKTNEVSNEFKIIIKDFLIPDNIYMNQYYANLKSLNSDIVFFIPSMGVSKSLSMPRVYPKFYPDFIIAGYPDVIVNLLNYPERSDVFKALTEDLLLEMIENPIKKNKYFRLLINEYLQLISPILECTEQYLMEIEKSKLLYPIMEYDNLGRLNIKVELKSEYEEKSYFFYNDSNQIIRIDKTGENTYGSWKLFPYMLFDYDINGLLNHYIEYGHGRVNEEVFFINEYDNNNRLISRKGSKIEIKVEPYSFKRTYRDFNLQFNYKNDYVEIVEYFLNINVPSNELIKTLHSFTGLKIYSDDFLLKE